MKENSKGAKRVKVESTTMTNRKQYAKSQIQKQLLFLTGLFAVQIYLYSRHTEVDGSPCLNLRGPIGWANFIIVSKMIFALSVYFTIDSDPEDRTPQ